MAIYFLPPLLDPTSSTTALPYTASPLALVWADILLFLSKTRYLLGIILPIFTYGSGPLDELYIWSWANLFDIFLHIILVVLQAGFLLSLPAFLLLSGWMVVAWVAGFVAANWAVCLLLNGKQGFVNSQVPGIGPRKGERWIFVNGVAVGKHWLQSNVDRLALTFRREVMGVHNKTAGILFDVIQCLIERCFCYSTLDTRNSYVLVKNALLEPSTHRVILILHSQGAIEGGLCLDWLFADLPGEVFRKLEVYTFGAAANHFNNPTRAPESTDPGSPIAPPPPTPTTSSSAAQDPDPWSSPPSHAAAHDNYQPRMLKHVEHYANEGDFVAQWGVLSFARSPDHTSNRFVGQLFTRPGPRAKGHQLCQHYLDNMFPFVSPAAMASAEGRRRARVADENPFMDSHIIVNEGEAVAREEAGAARRMGGGAVGGGYLRDVGERAREVAAGGRRTVGDVSRLWAYRNGGVPAGG